LDARRQYALFFGLTALVVVAGFALGRPRRPRGADLLSAVPRDAWLVVTADVAVLRASPLAQPLRAARNGTPMGTLAEACGFDPFERVREVALVSPESGERGEFGLAFTGDLGKEELSACAAKVIRSRGGRASMSTRGAFAIVEDAADPTHARVAYREGGPFLVGRGDWLDAMVDAAEGRVERLRVEHAELRGALTRAAGAAPTVVLTALVAKPLRARLERELDAELGSEADKTYSSLLAVEGVGLAAKVGPSGSATGLAAELRCESLAACDEVKKLIERKRGALAGEYGDRLLGLGPLLDSLSVRTAGAALSATASAPTEDIARALWRLLSLAPPVGTALDAGASEHYR